MLVACLSHPSDLTALAPNPVSVCALALPEQPELPMTPRLLMLCISFPKPQQPAALRPSHHTTYSHSFRNPPRTYVLSDPNQSLPEVTLTSAPPQFLAHPEPVSSYTPRPDVFIHHPGALHTTLGAHSHTPIRNFSSLLPIHNVPTRMVR